MKKEDNIPINLDSEETGLLKLISLFQDEFSIDWLVELTGLKSSLILASMEDFVSRGILKRIKLGYYIFSNLKKKREILNNFKIDEQTEYHRRISEVLMKEVDDNSITIELAHHLEKNPLDLSGCQWLKKTGDLFLRQHNNTKAVEYYLTVIDRLSKIKSDEANKLYIETVLRYAKISLGHQKMPKVLSVLEKALSKAKELDNPSYQALIKMNMASSEWLLGRDSTAIKHYEESIKIAKKIESNYALEKIDIFSTFFYFHQGLYRELIELYEKYVPEITKFPKDMLPVLNVAVCGYSYAHTGQVSQALGVLDALRQHTHDAGDNLMEAYAVGTIGLVMFDIGKTEEARLYFEREMELAIKTGDHWQEMASGICLAVCHYMMGNSHSAAGLLANRVHLSKEYQFNVTPQEPYIMLLCWGIKEGTIPPVPGLSIEDEIAKALSTRNVFLRGIAYRYQALLERKNGSSHEKILGLLKHSLEELKKSGSIIEIAKTQFETARQHLLVGADESATEMVRSTAIILAPISEDLIPDDLKPLCRLEKEKGNEFLTEILKLGQDIVNIRESRDLVLQIIGSVNRLTGAERGALFLNANGSLKLKASKNLTIEQIEDDNFSPSMKIIEEVANTGIGLIKGLESNEGKNEQVSAKAIRSVICVPMMLRNDLKGILYHDNRLLGSAFKESDLNLLAYFAALAAIALDNISSYEEIQAENQKLAQEKEFFEEQYYGKISAVNIIGKSEPIKRIMKQINQVAETDANVLILGDTGVGKELVATAIHSNSLRKDKPFVCVQCSALPEKLLPSELFGYEKGAFTGANRRKLGRFELANGGTIFLDEMGDLSLDMQVQLLRALETKRFERVGGTQTIKSDFRLVAATNRDLKEEVTAGRFRRDLYYRLNVFPIHVPSLKERRGDIPLLIEYFVQLTAKKLNKKYQRIDQDDIRSLCDYDWPGNVRELQNLVERAVIIHTGPMLKLSPLILAGSFDTTTKVDITESNNLSLRDNERRIIFQALQKTNWRVSGSRGAAKLLNINPSTLNFRMQKLGIKRPS